MGRWSARRLLMIVVVLLAFARPSNAQSVVPIETAQDKFEDFERRYAITTPVPSATPTSPTYAVQQAAYVGATVTELPPPTTSTTVIPPADGRTFYPSAVVSSPIIESPPSDAWCLPPTGPVRTSDWTAAIEIIPSDTFLTDGQFGRWDDNNAVAIRLILGYEDSEGLGIRGRFWGLSQDVSPPADDITLSMSTGTLDLYKRVFLDRTEIAFGGGPAGGNLEFVLSDDSHSRFEGGGITMFLDGYYTLQKFDKSEIGAIARARYTMLIGDWRDTTGGIIVPRTDNDTMSVVELAWGLEYRRRFGPCDDHHWFLGILAEYQRWQSDWMSNLVGTQIGVGGVNVYSGITW